MVFNSWLYTTEAVCTHTHGHVCQCSLALTPIPLAFKTAAAALFFHVIHTPSISWLLLNTGAWMSLKLCKLNENVM
jgi:hypothetical protein